MLYFLALEPACGGENADRCRRKMPIEAWFAVGNPELFEGRDGFARQSGTVEHSSAAEPLQLDGPASARRHVVSVFQTGSNVLPFSPTRDVGSVPTLIVAPTDRLIPARAREGRGRIATF